ncbi:hypothetical protein phytr_10960 [Candidatus Phycorickettsia trachydisci]|uniref:Phosphodiester glycosidase domain-containing protein n=1 Tax=Candidatus Phycorickettsia trachydisci TaxID=2115978 RepID=A0A2P1P9R3_9RICK|nr:phosphodiester glycosidase family protein [Candidatus Phycorickettsia trachydisci]AVP88022.1 hypothetical protein phytr_10960 [Candidatus Phycorickettsia trachydisci]
MKKAFWVVVLIFHALLVCACYEYERKVDGRHTIHIVTIDPKNFDIDIVKAESSNDRETIDSIAKRINAEIAINGGFFEINQHASKPSGTLVIKGKSYKIINRPQPLIIIDSKGLSIKFANPINYVKESVISGMPILVQDSKIPENIAQRNTAFYTSAHARTSLGIRGDGKIIIVIAEHRYGRDLMSITMGEIQSLIQEKREVLSKQFGCKNPGSITLNELKNILKAEFQQEGTFVGLSILELDRFMQSLGCKDAINLDGGGSSTLWIKDKVVNQTFGDEDEAVGLKVLRPVHDAIVFKKPKP